MVLDDFQRFNRMTKVSGLHLSCEKTSEPIKCPLFTRRCFNFIHTLIYDYKNATHHIKIHKEATMTNKDDAINRLTN